MNRVVLAHFHQAKQMTFLKVPILLYANIDDSTA
jgi:hypothetical protein